MSVEPRNYRTRYFGAFGHTFIVTTNSPPLGQYLDYLLESMVVEDGPAVEYCLTLDKGGVTLRVADVWFTPTANPNKAISQLLWHVNHEMIRRTKDVVLVHAAAAALNGVGVVFPAPMEAGKSTLVAGLVLEGFQYLTDEAVGVDAAHLGIHPYAKPLSLDPGSWSVLPSLEPVSPPGQGSAPRTQWHIPPHQIRPDAVAPITPPRLLVAPMYRRGALTSLIPASRAEMLLLLGECAFLPQVPARQVLSVLARLVKRCECYHLKTGDLNEGVRIVRKVAQSLI